MDIIIIAGFLGSGKTTLLLRIARSLVEDSGRNVAIIENEVGKVGVDDQTLAAEGLTVKTLFSGCVCCSLRVDLVQTLLELERTVKPDVVIIEPSGVAAPHHLVDALIGYGGDIGRKLVVTLIDAVRARIILNRPPLPIVENGIAAAGLILVNKIDGVAPEQLKTIEARIKEFRPDATIAFISALTGLGCETLPAQFAAMLSPSPARVADSAPAQSDKIDTDATVFAEKFAFAFAPPLRAEEARQRLASLLTTLAAELAHRGCTLIGHIKAIVQDNAKAGYMLMSITEFGAEPTVRGKLGDGLQKGTLTLNAIVYGVDSLTLALSARERVRTFSGELERQ